MTRRTNKAKAAYEERRQALTEVQDRLEDLARGLGFVAEFIKQWDRILLPDETKESNALQDLGYSKPVEIDLQDWVTNADFFEVLRQWRTLRQEVQNLYGELSEYDDVEPLPETPSQVRLKRSRYRTRPNPPKPRRRSRRTSRRS